MGFKFPILIAGFCLVTGAVNAEELNAYSIMPEKYASKIFAEFTKDTGIKVNFLRFSSGEALARLTAEKKNPQVDVMLGGPADTYAVGRHHSALLLNEYQVPRKERHAGADKMG